MKTLLEDVQAVLSTTPERWQRLVSTLPVELLARPPIAGEWSALNCLQHLADAERQLFPIRLRAFLAGQALPDFDPHQPHTDLDALTPAQLAATFAQDRQASQGRRFGTHRTASQIRHSHAGPNAPHMGRPRPDAYCPGRALTYATLYAWQWSLAPFLPGSRGQPSKYICLRVYT